MKSWSCLGLRSRSRIRLSILLLLLSMSLCLTALRMEDPWSRITLRGASTRSLYRPTCQGRTGLVSAHRLIPYASKQPSAHRSHTRVDRSLSSTPISENPQVSPVVITGGGAVMSRKGSDAFVEKSAAVESVYETVSQVRSSPNNLNAWQRRFAHLSYASMDMEIVVPPGPSEVEIIQPLNVSKKSGHRRGHFF